MASDGSGLKISQTSRKSARGGNLPGSATVSFPSTPKYSEFLGYDENLSSKERGKSIDLQLTLYDTPVREWFGMFGTKKYYTTAVVNLFRARTMFGIPDIDFKREIDRIAREYRDYYGKHSLNELAVLVGTELTEDEFYNPNSEATTVLPVQTPDRTGRRRISPGQSGPDKKSSAKSKVGPSSRYSPGQSGPDKKSLTNSKLGPSRLDEKTFDDRNVTKRRSSQSKSGGPIPFNLGEGESSPYDSNGSSSDTSSDSNIKAIADSIRARYAKISQKNKRAKKSPKESLTKHEKQRIKQFVPKSPRMKEGLLDDPEFLNDVQRLVKSSETKTAVESLMAKKRVEPSGERRRSAYLPPLSTASDSDSDSSDSEVELTPKRRRRGTPYPAPLSRLRLPEYLKFDGSEDWNSFHAKFELHITGYEKDHSLTTHLVSCLQGQALELVTVVNKQCVDAGKPKPTYKDICRLLARNYFRPEDTTSKLHGFQSAQMRSDEDYTMFRTRLLRMFMEAMPDQPEHVAEQFIHAKFMTALPKSATDKISESKNKTSLEIACILDDKCNPLKNLSQEHVLANEDFDEDEDPYWDSYEYNAETEDLYAEDDFGEEVDEDGNACAFTSPYPKSVGHQRAPIDGGLRGMPYRDYSRLQGQQKPKSDYARFNGKTPPQFRGRRLSRGGYMNADRTQFTQGRGRGYNPNYNQRRGNGFRNNNRGGFNNQNRQQNYAGNLGNQNRNYNSQNGNFGNQTGNYDNQNSGYGNQGSNFGAQNPTPPQNRSNNSNDGCSFCGKPDHIADLCPSLARYQNARQRGDKQAAGDELQSLLNSLSLR